MTNSHNIPLIPELNVFGSKQPLSKQEEIAKVTRTLTKRELFLFSYVPFVIARLVWDYIDTITDMCKILRIQETKKLSRAIRELKNDYDYIHRKDFIQPEVEDFEGGNMLNFEEAAEDITRLFLINLRGRINIEHPELEEQYRMLLISVYQCRIILRSLLRYCNKQSAHVGNKLGWQMGCVLPPCMQKLPLLIIEFAGDKKLSSQWLKTEEEFINAYVARMGQVEFVSNN